MLAKEVKTGSVVNYQGSPVLIQKISVQSPSARGAATLYKFRARNLVTKQKKDRTVTLMYTDAAEMHLLDGSDYNQYSLPLEEVELEQPYITENLEGMLALLYNGECVGVQIPTTIELEITETDPAVKGDSATKRTKPATLQTGLIVQVPEYLKTGERIKVDSRTAQYISRA
jgi:elongation factor P